jgi:hypothetical protein
LPRIYRGCARPTTRAQRALWADVEIFTFAGEVYRSALVPAPFARVEQQLTAISPFVDKILIYQYQGLMNPPASDLRRPRGFRPTAHDYRRWLDDHRPAK